MNSDDSRLVLRDIPVLLWLFGLVFAAIGALIIVDTGQWSTPALALFAFGLGTLLLTSVLTITADRVTRTLTLDYRSALRHVIKQVAFDEMAGINVERSMTRNRSTFQVSVARKDGRVVRLRSYSSSGSKGKEALASQLREFIGVVQPSPQVAELRETDGVRWTLEPRAARGSAGAHWHSPEAGGRLRGPDAGW